MALGVAEEVSETADNFVNRTLSFVTPAAAGVRVVVLVNLYTSTGVQTTAGMLSDSGGHTWTQQVGLTGDANTGGVAILSTLATTTISSVTLTPGGSGNYCDWAIVRLNGNADLDDFETGSGVDTAPTVPTMTSTTTDGLGLCVISTRNQSSDQTLPSGWTAIHIEKDNSTHLAGAMAYSPNISSAGSVNAVWATSNSSQWYAAGIIYKAVASVPSIYMVMGGTETEGWFGHDGKGGADSTADIVFDPAVPAGAAIVVVMTVYGADPTLSLVSDDGGNTWTIDKQVAYNSSGGDGQGGSVTVFRSVLTSSCSTFNYDATSLSAGSAGRYGQLGAYVFAEPDTVNGFFTATPVSNTQFTASTITAGTLAPATNKAFFIFVGDNRGHTENLKPYTKPSGYSDASLIHSEIDGDGEESAVHDSITQSGWWFGKLVETSTPDSSTFVFSTTTAEARSIRIVYNLMGGTASGKVTKSRRTHPLGMNLGMRRLGR
jgi:hypothetical protein